MVKTSSGFLGMNKALTEYLLSFVSENKRQKFQQALANRTRFLTVVLEDIYQPHNASAVVRSCDCFGIQDFHIIENRNAYRVNPDIVLGASKWVNICRYNRLENNTLDCFEQLRNRDYKIIATTPHKEDVNLEDFVLDHKTALVFGNEPDGLSETALEHADGFLKIPMFGFTESLNISVSAAICLHTLSLQLRKSSLDWPLSDEEKNDILHDWAFSVLNRAELLEKDFLLKQGSEKT